MQNPARVPANALPDGATFGSAEDGPGSTVARRGRGSYDGASSSPGHVLLLPSSRAPHRTNGWTALNIHEYQAKELLKRYGVAVPTGRVAYTPKEAEDAAKELGGPIWVVKSQIHAGGRGAGALQAR